MSRCEWRAVAAAVFLLACDHTGESAHVSDMPPTATPATPEPIDVVRVITKPLDATTRLEGELVPYESVALFARVNAFVSSVLVDRGSVVRKGDVLAVLVAPELAAQRAEAEAKARASRSNYERLKAAAATPGAVADNEVEAAAGSADAARARAESLGALERYLRVSASFDAVVTERNVHPGALVGPGSTTPMLRLEGQKRLRLTVAVPEPLAGMVIDGAEVRFTVRSFPGESFPATVRRSAHSLDAKTRTMPVELDVDNGGRRLAPGMFAEVAWHARRDAPTLFVPHDAVVQTAESTFVLRVRNGILERVPVKRGASAGDLVEIFGDVGQGDVVVRRATAEQRDGTRVAPREGS